MGSRITSEFDIEFQVAGSWFRAGLRQLGAGVLLGGVGNTHWRQIDQVTILVDPGGSDDICIDGQTEHGVVSLRAKVSMSDDARFLLVNHEFASAPISLPLYTLGYLLEMPILVKLPGDRDHEAVFALLANLGRSDSSELTDPTGESGLAQSFTPIGRQSALSVLGRNGKMQVRLESDTTIDLEAVAQLLHCQPA